MSEVSTPSVKAAFAAMLVTLLMALAAFGATNAFATDEADAASSEAASGEASSSEAPSGESASSEPASSEAASSEASSESAPAELADGTYLLSTKAITKSTYGSDDPREFALTRQFDANIKLVKDGDSLAVSLLYLPSSIDMQKLAIDGVEGTKTEFGKNAEGNIAYEFTMAIPDITADHELSFTYDTGNPAMPNGGVMTHSVMLTEMATAEWSGYSFKPQTVVEQGKAYSATAAYKNASGPTKDSMAGLYMDPAIRIAKTDDGKFAISLSPNEEGAKAGAVIYNSDDTPAQIVSESGVTPVVYSIVADSILAPIPVKFGAEAMPGDNHPDALVVIDPATIEEAVDADPAGWNRLAGKNAFGTMDAIATRGWESSEAVVLATFEGFWDALSASGLAGQLKAPILLTRPDALNELTEKQIERLGAKTVYIVGGKGAVSDDVKKVLEDKNLTVERIAGANCMRTADAIAAKIAELGAKPTTCIIATHVTFQDALAVAPYASAKVAPVYLARNGELDAPTLESIKAAGYTDAIIVGGKGAVTQASEAALADNGVKNVKRLAGMNAYGTSREIANWAIEEQGMSANLMAVATGSDFYDALTGGPLCGSLNSVMVLASDNHAEAINAADENGAVIGTVAKNAKDITSGFILGGSAAVSKTVEDLLVGITSPAEADSSAESSSQPSSAAA